MNKIIKVIEGTIKQVFSYDIIIYLILMMVDKQVHYHVIPRYEQEVKLFKSVWKDSSWPGVPNLAGEVLEKGKLIEITSFVKDNLIE